MPCVNFRAARPHEPPRAKRKCRVILRNSRSRSSSHSENDAEYIMGLRKSGASREYNSIDVRFTSTLNAMALALRQQRMRERDSMSEDVEIRALAESLAGGMRIKMGEDEDELRASHLNLDTILESPETSLSNSSTDTVLIVPLALELDTASTENPQLDRSVAGDVAEHLYHPALAEHNIMQDAAVALHTEAPSPTMKSDSPLVQTSRHTSSLKPQSSTFPSFTLTSRALNSFSSAQSGTTPVAFCGYFIPPSQTRSHYRYGRPRLPDPDSDSDMQLSTTNNPSQSDSLIIQGVQYLPPIESGEPISPLTGISSTSNFSHLRSCSLLAKCTNKHSSPDQGFECLTTDHDHSPMWQTWQQIASHIQNSHPEYILSMPRPVKNLCTTCGVLYPDEIAACPSCVDPGVRGIKKALVTYICGHREGEEAATSYNRGKVVFNGKYHVWVPLSPPPYLPSREDGD